MFNKEEKTNHVPDKNIKNLFDDNGNILKISESELL